MDIKKSGAVTLKGVDVTIEGNKVVIQNATDVKIDSTMVSVTGSAKVLLDGGGATVEAMGGILKLNG